MMKRACARQNELTEYGYILWQFDELLNTWQKWTTMVILICSRRSLKLASCVVKLKWLWKFEWWIFTEDKTFFIPRSQFLEESSHYSHYVLIRNYSNISLRAGFSWERTRPARKGLMEVSNLLNRAFFLKILRDGWITG